MRINCGIPDHSFVPRTSASDACTVYFKGGSVVTLKAVPGNKDIVFGGWLYGAYDNPWSDPWDSFNGPLEFNVGLGDLRLTKVSGINWVGAFFGLKRDTLELRAKWPWYVDDYGPGPNGAHVTSTPAGIDCTYGGSCPADYYYFNLGTYVRLNIAAGAGNRFLGWDSKARFESATWVMHPRRDNRPPIMSCSGPGSCTVPVSWCNFNGSDRGDWRCTCWPWEGPFDASCYE
jgi:hypothetical protein